MAKHTLICVLSLLGAKNKELLTFGYDGQKFKGRQSNEAPIKALLSCHQDIERIIMLSTAQVMNNVIRDYPFPTGEEKRDWTTWEYINYSVDSFCKDQMLMAVPEIIAIDLDFSNSTEALPKLIDALEPGETVDIDITGGNRDAANLIVMALQLMRYKKVKIRDIVYADYQSKEIRRVNEDYDLTKLITAVQIFTDNGQARQLVEFFRNNHSPSIQELCQAMDDFSQNVAMCRATKFEAAIQNIHEKMEAVLLDPSLQRHDELLFQSLIPTIQENFIHIDPEQDEALRRANIILAAIEWCLVHMLLQQALALYREKVPDVLVDFGLLIVDEENKPENISVSDVLACKKEAWQQSSFRQRVEGKTKPVKGFRFEGQLQQRSDKLSRLLKDYNDFRSVRNEVMHVEGLSGVKAGESSNTTPKKLQERMRGSLAFIQNQRLMLELGNALPISDRDKTAFQNAGITKSEQLELFMQIKAKQLIENGNQPLNLCDEAHYDKLMIGFKQVHPQYKLLLEITHMDSFEKLIQFICGEFPEIFAGDMNALRLNDSYYKRNQKQ